MQWWKGNEGVSVGTDRLWGSCEASAHCYQVLTPRYLHFQVSPCMQKDSVAPPTPAPLPLPASATALKQVAKQSPAQWINCDIRSFDFSVLGQYVSTAEGKR